MTEGRHDAVDPPREVEALAPGEMPSPRRIEAFSDGVFSIIITLLVLDLHVPRLTALHGAPLAAVLLDQWPVYVAFMLSFLQVGVIWANHHSMFHYIHRTDHGLLVYNLLLLLCVAVLPFTTAILSEYIRGDDAQRRIAAQIYSGSPPVRAQATLAARAGIVRRGVRARVRERLRQRHDVCGAVILLCAPGPNGAPLDYSIASPQGAHRVEGLNTQSGTLQIATE